MQARWWFKLQFLVRAFLMSVGTWKSFRRCLELVTEKIGRFFLKSKSSQQLTMFVADVMFTKNLEKYLVASQASHEIGCYWIF